MRTEDLVNVVRSLTPEEQDAVGEFVEYLKQRRTFERVDSPYLRAADEFIAEHPELLRRLAQ